ncbi:MAG: DEAD/DEAH box helicase [Planctomycetota bacterium]
MHPVQRFAELEQTHRVIEVLRPGAQRAAGGLWGGSAALLLAAVRAERKGPLLVITADDEASTQLAGDLRSFGERDVRTLCEQLVELDGRPEPNSRGERLQTLAAIDAAPQGDRDWLVLASLGALIDGAPKARAMRGGQLSLRVGERVHQTDLLDRALTAGLRKVPVVLAPGEASLRGDVLDLYPLGSPVAVRLEFFDDEIESIRRFDPATQRSLAVTEEIVLSLGSSGDTPEDSDVIEHFGRPDLVVVQVEPLRLDERRQQLALHHTQGTARLQTLGDTFARLTRLDVSSLPSQDVDFKVLSAGSAVGSGEVDPIGRLRSIRGLKGGDVLILCRTAEEQQRLQDIFARKDVSLKRERVTLQVGALSRGFRVPDLGLTVISNVEFAGVGQATRVRERGVVPTKALKSFFELGPGDLVVHAAHGIAVFEGVELVERGDAAEDHLRLCFRNDVRLLVPASKVHLVQKYVGAGGDSRPQLDRLGGRGFAKRKAEVCEELLDLAADLLDVVAQRALITRDPYPRDPLEDEFLDSFPFTDTPDQAQSWQEIRKDLEGAQVSERLLCGDVGFGKTELAMRAAFKVAACGKQVAVLVPTTILAEQHGNTFGRRFEPHGLRVEVYSRFRTGKQGKAVLEGLRSGAVDVVIGTHRLLSDDVAFRELSLLIVDEEQRFGVRHKERLKRLRLELDVLSLSATPIPRTLHAALLGVRGISTLSTPPTGRQDVDTRVCYWDAQIVREALERELAREGQIFVLHNRIDSLEHVAKSVQDLAPNARIAIGHGKMTASQMEKTVRRFLTGDVDVLVSTTIVENGLDLPRANTILVDRADCFGLAELHQLRGRVGRSDRKAYCYLLLDRAHPPSEDARKRLKALEELSHLGAGFAVAMKDLEIRGAGNLLGPQQSGHIAAIGYEMYCELLRGAIDAAKQGERLEPRVREVDVDMRVQAFLPEAIAQDPKERLELLREMDGAADPERTIKLAESLRDRFGALAPPMQNLLQIFLLKHLLLQHEVLGVQFTGDDRVVVRVPAGQPLGGAWLDAFADVRQVEAGKTHLILPKRRGGKPWNGNQVMALFLDALLGRPIAEKIRRACATSRRR